MRHHPSAISHQPSPTLLILSLPLRYEEVYLQNLWTDVMGMVEIESQGIDLDKTTKPYKETDQTV